MDRSEKPSNLIKLEKTIRKIFGEKFYTPEQVFEALDSMLKKHVNPEFLTQNAEIRASFLNKNITDDSLKGRIVSSELLSISAVALDTHLTIYDVPRGYFIQGDKLEILSRRTPNFETNMVEWLKTNTLSKSLEEIYTSVLENGTISHSKLSNSIQQALKTELKLTAKSESDTPRIQGTLQVFNINEKREIKEALENALAQVTQPQKLASAR